MRVALLLLLGSTAAATPASQAAAELTVAAVPAWQGWSRPGRTTELEIRVAGQGAAVVTIASDVQRIHVDTAVATDQPARMRVPITATQVVSVDAAVGDASSAQDKVTLSLSESPLLAWVPSGDDTGPGVTGFRTLALAPTMLPGSVAAYSSIDALAISAGTLAALDQQQMIALLDHVAGCGRTVLVGAAPDTAALFASGAGCGGLALGSVASPADVATELERLLQHSLREMPRAGSLAALSGADLAPWRLVVAILAGCAALILLVTAFTASVPLQAALAGLLALAAAGFVQSRPSAAQLAVWAEAESGQRLAQYRALQRTTLQRRGPTIVALHGELASPSSCGELNAATWHWDAGQQRFTRVALPGRLFDSVSLCYSGSFPIARDAARQIHDDGRMELRNTGPSDWPPGTLLWRGAAQPLPRVARGADHVPETDAAGAGANGAQRLASSRTPLDGAALLWPLDLGVVTGAPASSQAWLLLAASKSTAGSTP